MLLTSTFCLMEYPLTHFNYVNQQSEKTYPHCLLTVRIIDRLTFVAVIPKPSTHQMLKPIKRQNKLRGWISVTLKSALILNVIKCKSLNRRKKEGCVASSVAKSNINVSQWTRYELNNVLLSNVNCFTADSFIAVTMRSKDQLD